MLKDFYCLTNDDVWASVELERIEGVTVNGVSPVYRVTTYQGLIPRCGYAVGVEDVSSLIEELFQDGYSF